MTNQKKLSTISTLTQPAKNKIGEILDLEKKYFNIFWELFTSNEFTTDLSIIENEIKLQYEFLQNTWELKNKLKVPAERLVRQYVYKNLSHLVEHIYPSAVSSDVAFITKDAVINIDIKTLDKVGNKGDISNLQFENNQSSFRNVNLDISSKYPESGVRVECLLPLQYSYNSSVAKPMLTYFFTIVYQDDNSSFSLCRDSNLETIHLKCLPNGFTSILFDYDIVNNFKTYTYLEKKHGFEPIYLTNNKNDVEKKIKEFVKQNPNYDLINGRTKLGVYSPSQIHPKYNTKGVSWFPVPRKKKTEKETKYYLSAINKGNTSRLSNTTLITRYDSTDTLWYGLKKYTLR